MRKHIYFCWALLSCIALFPAFAQSSDVARARVLDTKLEIAIGSGDYEAVSNLIKEYESLDTEMPSTYYLMNANVLEQLGDVSGALQSTEKFLENAPSDHPRMTEATNYYIALEERLPLWSEMANNANKLLRDMGYDAATGSTWTANSRNAAKAFYQEWHETPGDGAVSIEFLTTLESANQAGHSNLVCNVEVVSEPYTEEVCETEFFSRRERRRTGMQFSTTSSCNKGSERACLASFRDDSYNARVFCGADSKLNRSESSCGCYGQFGSFVSCSCELVYDCYRMETVQDEEEVCEDVTKSRLVENKSCECRSETSCAL